MFIQNDTLMRKIIHIDMDCFYAAVEMRDNPALRHIPIAIGGSANNRGVISTCNYPARRFGVRSAMATAYALKLCPSLTLVKGRMDVYAQESQKIRQIFADYTDIIEPLSWDEAYLDVTHSPLHKGSATLIAEEIRSRIKNELGLTASAGVAPCKFVAKVASDENKPDGICVVTPDKLDAFVRQMPLKKIPGVGKVTMQKLERLGLFVCDDVRQYSLELLQQQFGKFGQIIWDRSHAIDARELITSRESKSIGVERTLPKDLHALQQIYALLPLLLEKLHKRIAQHTQRTNAPLNIKSLGIKLKFSDFSLTSVEQRHLALHADNFKTLLEEGFERADGRHVRLVGLFITLAHAQEFQQLSLDF